MPNGIRNGGVLPTPTGILPPSSSSPRLIARTPVITPPLRPHRPPSPCVLSHALVRISFFDLRAPSLFCTCTVSPVSDSLSLLFRPFLRSKHPYNCTVVLSCILHNTSRPASEKIYMQVRVVDLRIHEAWLIGVCSVGRQSGGLDETEWVMLLTSGT